MVDETSESCTVAVQYFSVNSDKFRIYQTQFAPDLQEEYLARFGSIAPAFRTVLHALEEGEVVSDINRSEN